MFQRHKNEKWIIRHNKYDRWCVYSHVTVCCRAIRLTNDFFPLWCLSIWLKHCDSSDTRCENANFFSICLFVTDCVGDFMTTVSKSTFIFAHSALAWHLVDFMIAWILCNFRRHLLENEEISTIFDPQIHTFTESLPKEFLALTEFTTKTKGLPNAKTTLKYFTHGMTTQNVLNTNLELIYLVVKKRPTERRFKVK